MIIVSLMIFFAQRALKLQVTFTDGHLIKQFLQCMATLLQ